MSGTTHRFYSVIRFLRPLGIIEAVHQFPFPHVAVVQYPFLKHKLFKVRLLQMTREMIAIVAASSTSRGIGYQGQLVRLLARCQGTT
jgi:hypothetical protein